MVKFSGITIQNTAECMVHDISIVSSQLTNVWGKKTHFGEFEDDYVPIQKRSFMSNIFVLCKIILRELYGKQKERSNGAGGQR